MVEPPEEDLEAGNSSPPSIAEVFKTDDIDITIQEINENQEKGDEDNISELTHDDEGVETKKKLTHDDD